MNEPESPVTQKQSLCPTQLRRRLFRAIGFVCLILQYMSFAHAEAPPLVLQPGSSKPIDINVIDERPDVETVPKVGFKMHLATTYGVNLRDIREHFHFAENVIGIKGNAVMQQILNDIMADLSAHWATLIATESA